MRAHCGQARGGGDGRGWVFFLCSDPIVLGLESSDFAVCCRLQNPVSVGRRSCESSRRPGGGRSCLHDCISSRSLYVPQPSSASASPTPRFT
eukprot:1395481-Prymnesium_polylepis.1